MNKQNKEKLDSKVVMYLIGFTILLVGILGTVFSAQSKGSREKALGVVQEVEEQRTLLENDTIEVKTVYHITYNTLGGEIITYSREKKDFEDLEKGQMFFIYYHPDFPENIIEETKSITIYTILIVLGTGIVLTNLSLMLVKAEQERKDKMSRNLAEKNDITFKVNREMMEDIASDTKMREAALVDDEIHNIDEENKNKSLLERHLENANKVGTAYDANGNPINMQNNNLNTGSMVDGNGYVPQYGNGMPYGQNNQGNYYGNNYYGNNYYGNGHGYSQQ